MASRLTILAIAIVALLAASARATSFAPRYDLQVVARDLRTGQQVWRHLPPKLRGGDMWLLPGGLLLSPYEDSDNNLLFLDPKSGRPIPPFDWQAQLSAVGRREAIVLSNGWTLADFRSGTSKTLEFFDSTSTRTPVWTLDPKTYPHEVVAWEDYVYWTRSYLSGDGIIHAHKAGSARPTWTVNLNDLVEPRPQPLTRMKLTVHRNTLFVQSDEQIFGLHPRNGALWFRYDLAKDLGLRFRPDFWRGGVPVAQLQIAGDVLLIAYECRVIAIDMKSHRYLWHLAPDVFPSKPRPVIGDGVVYMLAGPRDELFPLDKPVKDRGSAAVGRVWPLVVLGIAFAIFMWWLARRSTPLAPPATAH
jgi:hypothetical protein